jgi:hypothetical protein
MFDSGSCLAGYGFPFYVISASPQDVVQSALEGIVPADRIFGTQLEYDSSTGEISAIRRLWQNYCTAGIGNQDADDARSHDLYGRRQFGPIRDAPREYRLRS